MYEMSYWTFNTILLVAVTLIAIGILLVCYFRKNKKKGVVIAASIIGWLLIVSSVSAIIMSFIFFISYSGGGEFGLLLFTFISPLFILGGAIFTLAFGISSLTKGYRKDKDGNKDTSKIIRGWALLILAVAIVVITVVSLTTLFTYYSNIRGDKPIVGMGQIV